jgi:hypothetical protein
VKTLGHVCANLGKAQRTQQAGAGDALLERLKLGALENGEQFGLAAENDLEQFFLIGVGVAEKANFFEQLDAHQVRFVDQEDRGATLLLRLEKHLMQGGETTRLARCGAVNFVFFEDGLEKLRRSERRIDKEGGDEASASLGFFCEDLKSGVKQSGFAGADWPSNNGETFALQNSLEKNFERGAMRVSQMKKSGVRCETERFFFELVKGRVQIVLPRVPEKLPQQTNKLIQPKRGHFSYQTANSTTNTESRNKCIGFKRFRGYPLQCSDIGIRFPAGSTENGYTRNANFFRARPDWLDAENASVGTLN